MLMLMEKSHERAITSTICIVVVAVVGNIPYFILFVFRLIRAVVRVCIRLLSAHTNVHKHTYKICVAIEQANSQRG